MNSNSSYSHVPSITAKLLDQLEKRVSQTGEKQVSDEELLTLHSVFGQVLQRALDILEKQTTLTLFQTSKKTRQLIEIKGENNRCYRVFPRINFCPCLAFRHQVIEKKHQVTCKHVIAARLALILDRTTIHEVTNDQYLMLLKSMYELEADWKLDRLIKRQMELRTD